MTIARDRTAESRADGGFLNLRRLDVRTVHPDGQTSESFTYDLIERRTIDAVAIVAYTRGLGADPHVFLRTAPRVPLLLREGFGGDEGNMWEVPAGMIDVGESPREAAARETEEELGFRVAPNVLEEMGPWTWPLAGCIAERNFFFCVDVSAHPRAAPTEDGSPLERGAAIESFPLATLLASCRAGLLRDTRTELALRRFAERT